MPYITVRIDRDELRRLRELAEAEDRTPAQKARRLLRQALIKEGGDRHRTLTMPADRRDE